MCSSSEKPVRARLLRWPQAKRADRTHNREVTAIVIANPVATAYERSPAVASANDRMSPLPIAMLVATIATIRAPMAVTRNPDRWPRRVASFDGGIFFCYAFRFILLQPWFRRVALLLTIRLLRICALISDRCAPVSFSLIYASILDIGRNHTA
jgi:hypothetical protein